MNIIIDLIFIYIYITALIIFKIINFENEDFLFQKILLFIAIFVFVSLLEIVKRNKSYCPKSTIQIFKEASYLGLISIIGISFYNDLDRISKGPSIVPYINSNIKYVSIPIIVTTTMLCIKVISFLFNPTNNLCMNE